MLNSDGATGQASLFDHRVQMMRFLCLCAVPECTGRLHSKYSSDLVMIVMFVMIVELHVEVLCSEDSQQLQKIA